MAHTLDLRTGSLRARPLEARRLQAGAAESGRFHFAQLDFTRIAAESGAIAINAAALLLLLAPLNMHLTPAAEKPDEVVIIPVTPKKPPPPIIDKVEVVKPHTTTPVVPTITPPKIEVQQPPVVDPLPGDIAVDPTQIADATIGNKIAITESLAGAHLEYEVAPPPTYPREAMRDGLTGTVTLRVLVGIDGKPIDVQIERSSGHRVLDAAAKRHVLAKWLFKPAMQDGQVVQAIGLVPIDFNLDR
jgi:protein TonB